MNTVTLKNGVELPTIVVLEISDAIRILFDEEFFVFLDLLAVCQNQTKKISKNSQKSRLLRSFIEVDDQGNAFISASVRSIMLCSIEGEGLKIKLVSPLKK